MNLPVFTRGILSGRCSSYLSYFRLDTTCRSWSVKMALGSGQISPSLRGRSFQFTLPTLIQPSFANGGQTCQHDQKEYRPTDNDANNQTSMRCSLSRRRRRHDLKRFWVGEAVIRGADDIPIQIDKIAGIGSRRGINMPQERPIVWIISRKVIPREYWPARDFLIVRVVDLDLHYKACWKCWDPLYVSKECHKEWYLYLKSTSRGYNCSETRLQNGIIVWHKSLRWTGTYTVDMFVKARVWCSQGR